MNALDQKHPIEDRLRASLRERARDVEASPSLWQEVEDRITARRRFGRLALVGGTALAVMVGAVAVPRLLDESADRPDVVVDGSPSPAPTTDAAPGPGDGVAGAYPAPSWALAVNGRQLVALRMQNGDARATMPLDVAPQALAVRPSLDGQVLELAYVARSGDEMQLRLRALYDVTTPDDLAELQDRSWADRLLDSHPVQVPGIGEVTPGGLAWSPDGEVLAWVSTTTSNGVPTTELVAYDVPRSTPEQVTDTGPGPEGLRTVLGRGVLANGASAGTLTLKDLTWDATLEDGMVGRAFVVGGGVEDPNVASVGRAWQVAVTRDATGVIDFGGLDPIDLAEDFDQAGPGYGVYALQTVGVAPATFDLVQVGDGPDGWSLVDQQSIATSRPDVATAADVSVVSLGDRLVVHRDGGVVGSSSLDAFTGGWGPVDLVATPWTAAFSPADQAGPAPSTQPTPQPAQLPEFVVTTDEQSIDLRRSDGSRIQTLYRLASPADGRILGLDVRPGSSTEDLTVVFSTEDADVGGVTTWTLRGRADDQAGLAVEVEPWPAQYQPSADAAAFADGEVTVPMFFGGGQYVAFVENTGDGAGLRIFGWLPDADQPGTGRTADDNVAFDRGPVPQSLEYVSDVVESRSGGRGHWVLFTAADGTTSVCEYEIQPDGALAEVICEGDYGVDQDVADATDQVLLVRRGPGLVLIDSGRTSDVDDEFQWDLPDEVRAADPTRVWMTGLGGHVFVGTGDRAWLVTAEGAQEFPDATAYVAGVR